MTLNWSYNSIHIFARAGFEPTIIGLKAESLTTVHKNMAANNCFLPKTGDGWG